VQAQGCQQMLLYEGSLTPCLDKVFTARQWLVEKSAESRKTVTQWPRATDKTSGEMSRVMSAQLPSNSLTMAVAIPLDDRRDDSQDNLRYTRLGCAMAVQETCETTRNLSTRRSRGSRAAVRATANATSCKLLPGISSSTFSHDTQKL